MICVYLSLSSFLAQLYKKNVELAFKKHEESYKGMMLQWTLSQTLYLGLCPPQDEEAVKNFATVYRTLDKISKEFMENLEIGWVSCCKNHY